MLKEYQLLIASVLLFAAAVIFAGTLYFNRSGNPAPPLDRAGGAVATTSTKLLPPPSDIPHRPLALNAVAYTGAITSLQTDSIIINIGNSSTLDSSKLRTIKITSSTDIYTPGPMKDPAVLAKEVEIFRQKTSKSNNEGVIYVGPTPYTHIKLALSDLKPGMVATINPASAEGSTVTALEIFVLNSDGTPVK